MIDVFATVSPLVVALVAGVPALVSPLLLAALLGRQRKNEEERAERRQAVRRAEDRAEVAGVSRRQAEASRDTQEQLQSIHTLVNSKMTERMEAELDATIGHRAALIELVELKRATGREPQPETADVIAALEVRIEILKDSLADRREQAAVVDAQLKREDHARTAGLQGLDKLDRP